ncbi:MAG: DNA translocase FtsK [Dehalococcoides mccartyi]|jgi:DNA segregation ATPase FtsK/SpoIIIE and related proteins|uniref:Cell division protein FtsK n=2 Tax=root TaxID=1 RepID=A0AB33HNW3_9CHLR|nr:MULTISPECIES: DNA translocase FtsK [Dehalococcoides]AQU02826.1 cell division protein FtsK [Dehalococcoides mccartyi]AQU04154.1 cell division protein FtsK [Dehalococcoides mccartyi]MBF4482596.1 DNA translocase FtsK [Dehalococcoides mccartyi]MBJ7532405.1 DNA translocase FtsK [Dehalococcoides mccartyi]MDP4279818.1 DNA translocase FtsK [Dehalococcoides mccartyi]
MPKKEDPRDTLRNARPRAKSAAKVTVRPSKKTAPVRSKAKKTAAKKAFSNTPVKGGASWLWVMLIASAMAFVVWQWEGVMDFFANFGSGTAGLFGWGLLLILLGIIIAIVALRFDQMSEWAHRYRLNLWNKWLGGVVLILAAWGMLGMMDAGGDIGLSILGGNADINGFMRVLALIVLGVILIAPGAVWRSLSGLFRGIFSPSRRSNMPEVARLDRTVVSRPVFGGGEDRIDMGEEARRPLPEKAAPKIELPSIKLPSFGKSESRVVEVKNPLAAKSTPQTELPNMPPEAAAKEPKPVDERTDADRKQIASEVWKKYGEAEGIAEVDGWKLPPIEMLDKTTEIGFSEADNLQRARAIEEALASYGVEGKVIQINAGPTVTQFGVEPGWDRKFKEVKERDKDGETVSRQVEVSKTRVKVDRIASLANDLALALAAPSLRIEAPVPGKSIVGIEVPNTSFGVVSMRSVMETNTFQKILARSPLALALGKGAGGEAVSGDLTKMPHLLIAGATGSGKTVCLNSIICCMLLNNTPSSVKFIMIDPKRVELTPFNGLPHLATPVIVDVEKALSALRWLAAEMDRRYQTLAAAGSRNIEGYNKTRMGADRMAFIVLIIDELADLMMAGFDEVEHILCRLAQMARAVGIHLVVATQRPSVDVITGLIKANFPTRISFAVTSQVDSRTILDMVGAEKLLGRGDMLYMPTEAAKPKRLQGCYVSDAESERLIYFWTNQKDISPSEALKVEEITAPPPAPKSKSKDPLFDEAMALISEHNNIISASFLQRKMHIGYPRAARLADELREAIEGDDGKAEVPKDEY